MDTTPWTSTQTRSQYRAISWLRWRMFINGLRRKGGKGDVAALAIMLPIFALFACGLAFGAGAGAFYFLQTGHPDRLTWVLWAVFLICQMLNLNLGQPSTVFDPTQLIRFPLSVADYVLIRLFFGLLGPANVVAVMASLSIAIGIIIAAPALWLYALVALTLFALVNLFFTRMIFAWVDRWLSTRRAREILTGVLVFGSLGIQYLNFTYNPTYHHHRKIDPQHAVAAFSYLHRFQPWIRALPPSLTADSIVAAAQHRPGSFLLASLICALYGAGFLAIFARRMRTEFRGETFSDAATGTPRKKSAEKTAAIHAAASATTSATTPATPLALTDAPRPGLHSTLPAMLQKEFLYLRRNLGLFYGLLGPLFFVYIFVTRLTSHSSAPWILPLALGYGLLGVVAVCFNSFGLDGTGAQFYFAGPVRLRDVLLAKNLFTVGLALIETVAILGLLIVLAHPPGFLILLDCAFWLLTTFCIELTVGNYRSISAPKRIDLARTAQKQAAPMSALLAMAILAVSAAIFYALSTLTTYINLPWLLTALLALMFPIAAWIYWHNLEAMDLYAAPRADTLFAELGKKT